MKWLTVWKLLARRVLSFQWRSVTSSLWPTRMQLEAAALLGVSSQAWSRRKKTKGNEENAKFAKEYCGKVETELDKICSTILGVLDNNLIPKCSQDESKVFYLKMKADYYRYIAEFTEGDKKSSAAETARKAYDEAQKVAEKGLAVTHPIRLGLALNFSVFQFEVLEDTEAAKATATNALDRVAHAQPMCPGGPMCSSSISIGDRTPVSMARSTDACGSVSDWT